MAGNARGGKIREPSGGHIVNAGAGGFAEALDLQLSHGLLVFEKPETGADNLAGISEPSLTHIGLDEML